MTAATRNRRGTKLHRALAAACLCACLCTAQAADRAAETVQALRYGVTLFHFYQQDYFDALTELMAAQQLQQLAVHGGNAELLRGGMSLSYGMDREAGRIFQDLLSRSGDSIDRDQAWFYLGKMAWQRGEPERARLVLDQMSSDYRGHLAAEADYLRASIGLQLGDEPLAADYMQRLPEDSPWRYYLYYNMGASRAAQGDWATSVEYFRQFDEMPLRTEESKALRDKAFTAAGFAQMAAGDFQQARGDFTRVRLDSPMSDRALLGYGWASGQTGDYLEALSPWQVLSGRSMLSESARESLLAIPYAYEKLERHSIAMANYRLASDEYTAELQGLEEAIEAFRSGDLQTLLASSGDDTGEWLFGADLLPEGPYAPYLSHLITRHGFQVAMRELRDLRDLAQHLDAADGRLRVLTQVDEHQQRTWTTVVQGDRREQLQEQQRQLQQQIAALRARLDRAVAENDARLLASAEQGERWRRVDRAAALAEHLDAPAEQRHRLRLYRGLMLWDDNEQYPARVWQLQRRVQELESLAEQSVIALQRVDQAIAQRRQSDFAPRIVALQERVQRQALSVGQAIGRSEGQIRLLAVAELEHQAEQLTRALGQSRLAIARLYDLGSPEVPR